MKRILIAILSFFVLPIVSFAVENVNYDISNYYIKAKIQEDGSLRVKELIVLDGSFNGYERTINFSNSRLSGYDDINFEHSSIYNPDGVSDLKISAKYLSGVSYSNIDDNDYEEFEEVYSAEKGDKHKYTLSEDNDSITFRMYYESNRNKVGFLVEYTLDNFVVMHDDVAELYWTIITGDSTYNDPLNKVEVRIYLPDEDLSDNFRVWAHGPLQGDVSKEDNSYLLATIPELDADEDFDVRLTFDKDLITDDFSLTHTHTQALDEIIEVEEVRAEEANNLRKKLKRRYEISKFLSEVLTIVNTVGLFTLIFKYGFKPKTNFYAKYYREFIEDYPVEVIDFLYNKNVTPKALSAGIMNLVYKKVCKVEEVLNAKAKKNKKNYKFILVNKENLSEADQKLVSFLFETVGNGEEFTTDGLKSYASSLKTGSKFESNYKRWTELIKKEGRKQNFFKDKGFGGLLCFGLFIPTILVLVYSNYVGANSLFIPLPIIILIISVIYLIGAKAYNEKGALHKKKWDAFKNFLNDFGTFDVKELPEIALWERYLVYATVFGIAKKVQKDIEVKIKEMELTDTSISTTYTNLYIYDSISRSFSTAVTEGKKAYAASRANAYSSSSSGGGFGGGFSGGGGFGGGGGGGHGF